MVMAAFGAVNAVASVIIDNPYANVDWSAWGQYKAALHTHTSNSDGANTPLETANEHYRLGYHILAFTDHSYTSSTPDKIGSPLTLTRIAELEAGVGRLGGDGMIFVPYTNERSGTFAAISPEDESHHVGTYWSNVSNSRRPLGTIFRDMAAEGAGIAVINHPGRYTGASRYKTTSLTTARSISNNPNTFRPYVNLFRDNPNAVGLEIINQFDWESQGDRHLWDNILTELMPTGRSVWGFSNDDSHSNRAIGYSYNVMVMPELSLSEFRNSMKTGAFFAFSRVDRQYGIFASGVSESRVGGNNLPNNAEADSVRNLSAPAINRITVNGSVISITTNSRTNNVVRWFTDGGVELPSDTVLDVAAHSNRIRSYVRATVSRSSRGVLYTQPFGIQFTTGSGRALPVLQSINTELADVTAPADAGRTQMGLRLPSGTNITTSAGVRPATIMWDMNNITTNPDHTLTVRGAVRLHNVANPNNISLDVSVRVILKCGRCEPRTELVWRPNLHALTGGRAVSGGVGIWSESSNANIHINNGVMQFRANDGATFDSRNILIATAGGSATSGWNSTGGFTGVVGTEYRLSFLASVNTGERSVDIGANRVQVEIDRDGIVDSTWADQIGYRTTLTAVPSRQTLNFVYHEGRIRLVGSRSSSGTTATAINISDLQISRITEYCHGHWCQTVSVAERDRDIVQCDISAVVSPVVAASGEFKVGPNPVDRRSGGISFYWDGKRINNGILTIYDVSGNVVNRIVVGAATCRPSFDNANRRQIGTWDLTDNKGRSVPNGAYLIRGSLIGVDGKRERVSEIIGIR